jgi:inosine triphosphate pyrophosphatase
MKKLKTGKNSAVITKDHEGAELLEETKHEEKKLKKVVLITGNANKLAEFQQIIHGKAELSSKNIDIEEFQGECEEIAKKKVLQAFGKTKRQTVVVEDTSLCFNALGGLPGPYIRWFLENLKPEGLNKMIAKFEDKTAYAQCIIGYMDRSLKEPKLFIGRTNGKIVMPRGTNNFGWDPIFEPEGFSQTYSEMDKEQKK